MSEHTIYEAMVQQVTGLAAERDVLLARLTEKTEPDAIENALRKQIAGLRTERDALRERVDYLTAKLEQARRTADTWRRAYIAAEAAPE